MAAPLLQVVVAPVPLWIKRNSIANALELRLSCTNLTPEEGDM